MNLKVLRVKRNVRRKPLLRVTFEMLPAESTFVPRLVLPKRDTPPLKENSPTCAETIHVPAKKTATTAQRCIRISPMMFCPLQPGFRLSQDEETALYLVPGGAVRRE